MEEILHQLVGSLSHYWQGFIHPRWCRICSINGMFKVDSKGSQTIKWHTQNQSRKGRRSEETSRQWPRHDSEELGYINIYILYIIILNTYIIYICHVCRKASTWMAPICSSGIIFQIIETTSPLKPRSKQNGKSVGFRQRHIFAFGIPANPTTSDSEILDLFRHQIQCSQFACHRLTCSRNGTMQSLRFPHTQMPSW